MKRQIKRALTPFAAAVLVLVFAALTGCDDKPKVYTDRQQDPSYQKELKGTVESQKTLAKSQAKIAAQMERLVTRARAALPEGATDDEIRAELDGHPEKYPGWKTLSATFAEVNASMEKELANARSIVRRRIQKEAADRKAVAEGKAVAQPTASK